MAREVPIIGAASTCPRFRYYTTTPRCVTFGRWLAFSVLQLPCGVLWLPSSRGPLTVEQHAERTEPKARRTVSCPCFWSRDARRSRGGGGGAVC